MNSESAAEQKAEMEEWFRLNYEDPAERTPYVSAEGGYIWIWGGPYSAREVLEEQFQESVPQELIDELVEELEGECWDWAPTPKPEDYDDYIIDSISSITQFYHTFTGSILDIEKLLGSEIDGAVELNFHRLLYLNVVIALETYLSDAFISTVVPDKDLFAKYVENCPEFQQRKIPLSEVIKHSSELESIVNTHLSEISWHNLSRVSKMYRDILEIQFPQDIGKLYRAVLIRHDIVHRNGKDRDGNEIYVGKAEIESLIEETEKFVQHIDQELPNGDH